MENLLKYKCHPKCELANLSTQVNLTWVFMHRQLSSGNIMEKIMYVCIIFIPQFPAKIGTQTALQQLKLIQRYGIRERTGGGGGGAGRQRTQQID